MYKIPLTNSPNQTFNCIVPVNGENHNLRFTLWYNYKAKYWLMSIFEITENKEMFENLPLLVSKGRFENILCQLGYMDLGMAGVVPLIDSLENPDNTNLGTAYILLWGDAVV